MQDILNSNGFFGNGRYRSYNLFCVYFKMKQRGMYIEVAGTISFHLGKGDAIWNREREVEPCGVKLEVKET